MIKSFAEFVKESYECDGFTDEELRDAEKDTMEYDKSLDADPDDLGEEEEEEE